MQTISLCMIVKNEEGMLTRCLKSVQDIVNEIIIVDTGSTDGTKQIARNFGARIFTYKWNDSFADARNFALSKAKMDWILIMDADDELVPEDREKLLQIANGGYKPNAYYMKTLCYFGDPPNEDNTVINVNIRLVRNHRGYKFIGNIHEHVIPPKKYEGYDGPSVTWDVRFRHYGYLPKAIALHDKRSRNIALIKRELKKKPDDCMMLFYLGNEYFAMSSFKDALRYFSQSYKVWDKRSSLGSKIILKIAMCYDFLADRSNEFKYIKLGLKFYPTLADFEFLRAGTYLKLNRKLPALYSLKKCVKMGDPPPIWGNLVGVGTFRPHIMLAQLYKELGDYKKALYHCRKTLSFSPRNRDAYGLYYHILCIKSNAKSLRARLERRMRPRTCADYIFLSDLFYDNGQYSDALYFLKKAEKSDDCTDSSMIQYYKGICLFYNKHFCGALRCFKKVPPQCDYHAKSLFFSTLCSTFLGHGIKRRLTNTQFPGEYNDVLNSFQCIMRGQKCTPLALSQKDSIKYRTPLTDLLCILLKVERFKEFEKAVHLLNLVEDDHVLLILAKIYYKNGLYKSAHDEFTRSIKLTGEIDCESLQMFYNVLARGF